MNEWEALGRLQLLIDGESLSMYLIPISVIGDTITGTGQSDNQSSIIREGPTSVAYVRCRRLVDVPGRLLSGQTERERGASSDTRIDGKARAKADAIISKVG